MKKGTLTRERIVDAAFSLASSVGLEGLSIGNLAAKLGLSKSGLFAHFGSKDELELEVLRSARRRFEDTVIRPALSAPRGEPRLRALLDHWLKWIENPSMPGGCIFVEAAAELDARPGPQREFLVSSQKEWLAALTRAAVLAIEAGHFREDTDAQQFAYELNSLMLGYHHAKRLLGDTNADSRLRRGFDRLLDSVRA
jgi:AcrR family transcriptional regulator